MATSIDLEQPLADALQAVAAVDNTPPDKLAGLILADWLAQHRERFVAAARALDRLAGIPIPTETWAAAIGDEPIEWTDPEPGPTPGPHEQIIYVGIDADGQPFTDLDLNDEAAALDETHGGAPSAGEPPPEHACPSCDFIGKSAQALGGHRRVHAGKTYTCDDCEYSTSHAPALASHLRSKHTADTTTAPKKPPSPTPTRTPPTTDGCSICGHHDAPKIIDGERLCRRCWTDAR